MGSLRFGIARGLVAVLRVEWVWFVPGLVVVWSRFGRGSGLVLRVDWVWFGRGLVAVCSWFGCGFAREIGCGLVVVRV